MATIQSVTGPVETSQLGRVLMHEHIIVLNPEVHANYPRRWNEADGVTEAVSRLKRLKAAGFDTLADLTVIPMGRNVERIRRISELSGVTVIVTTGLYIFDTLPRPLAPWGLERDPDHYARLFVDDIERGTAGTGIRAGLIKCTSDSPGMTPDVEMLIRAAARAHRQTGIPISTHSDSSSRGGLDQQRILDEEGVDLSRVIIGHCGDTDDLDYLEALLAKGSYLGMDRFGVDFLLPDADRVETVATLCERGHVDRILLSHDADSFNDGSTPEKIQEVLSNAHYTHIADAILPALRGRGIGDEQIERMLVDNPRRIFEIQGGY